MPDLVVSINGAPVPILLGENTTLAALLATRAQVAADRAEAAHAAVTEQVTSTNLYNPATMRVAGKYARNSTSLGTDAAWACAIIPVEPGQVYTWHSNAPRRVGSVFMSSPTVALSGTYDATAAAEGAAQSRTAPAGANYLCINVLSNTIPEPSATMVNAGAAALPYEPWFAPYPVITEAAAEPSVERAIEQTLDRMGGNARVYLAPSGSAASHVESNASGTLIRREFAAFPAPTSVTALPVNFNLGADYVAGAAVRTVTDDTAPNHLLGTTLIANHGYFGASVTAANAKTQADQGARYSNGSTEIMILRVLSSTSLFVAHTTSDDTAIPTGTYTHVSGGTNTADIVVTAAGALAQFYPCAQNRRIRALIDGEPVAERDVTRSYRESAAFVESYEVLERSEVLAWWQANGASVSGVVSITGRDPVAAVTNTYRYDRYGQLTIHMNYTALMAHTVADLMGLQAADVAGATGYYFPGTIPFSEGADAFDFANVETAARLNAYSTNLFITPARCEATGPLADRMLMLMGSNHVFAMGFLPLGAASLANRPVNCSNRLWEIRGNTDKVYGRYLDKGSFTMQPGESYSAVAYRWIGPKPAGRTASYPIFTEGRAYFFADWHDFAGRDRIELPVEFLGRSFTTFGSKNAVAIGDILTGDLLVDVDAATGNAWIALEVVL